jgi:hypothetical protein
MKIFVSTLDMTACGSGFAARKYKRRKEYIKNIFKTNFHLGATTMKQK